MRGPRKEVALRVRLDAALAAEIAAEAKTKGVTLSEVVRTRLGGTASMAEAHRSVEPAQRNAGGSNPSPATHVHRFGNRNPVTGLKKCACGKVTR